MTPWRITVGLLAAVSSLSATAPVSAQDWADANYRYRRPITVQNPTATEFAAGDIATFSYAPRYKEFMRTRPDGTDVKIYYYDGSSNVEVPQALLPMGTSSAKVLFALQAPMGATTLFTENLNAGESSYSQLPAGTKLDIPLNGDDGNLTVDLPFVFPYYNTTYNKITIGVDGYVALGEQNPSAVYNKAGSDTRVAVYPWVSDWSPKDDAAGIYYSADENSAVIRWELRESDQGAVIAKFAVVLYPNGDIRLVYGDTVKSPSAGIADPGTTGSYAPVKYGVSVPVASLSKVTFPAYPAEFDNHADILYNQAYALSTAPGYYAYYGNPADNGKVNRTAPAADKLVAYTFDDNTTQGWVAAGQGGQIDAAEGNLVLSGKGLSGDHPMAIAGDQTTILTDQLIYARVRMLRGDREGGILGRGTVAGQGYATMLDTFGAYARNVVRNVGGLGDMTYLGASVSYTAGTGWHNEVVQITGSGEGILVNSRFFPTGSPDPANWILKDNLVGATPGSTPVQKTEIRFESGAVGVTGWSGGGTDQGAVVLDYIYATDPKAEIPVFTAGDEESITATGLGILSGAVTIGAANSPVPYANVTLTPSAGGRAYVTQTDYSGTFSASVPAGDYTATVTNRIGAGATEIIAVTEGATATTSVSLTAANMVLNPSFEDPDPIFPNVKPRSWYRRDYGAEADPDPSKETLPWRYDTTGNNAHSGTDSVAFGGGAGLRSWDPEGTVSQVFNSDNPGLGPLVPSIPGGVYRISAWMKRTDTSGNPRVRIRDMAADVGSDTYVGSGATIAGITTAGGWGEVAGDYTAAGPFLSVRPYGEAIAAGQFVYFDDLSVTVSSLPSLPAPAPEYPILVTDANGNPLSNVAVVLADSTNSNPLADPASSYITDILGRVFITLQPEEGKTYTASAWRNGYFADSAPLNLDGLTTIVYDAPVAASATRGRVAASFYKETGGEPLPNINDNNEGTRWAGTGMPAGSATPQLGWVVIDLGKEASFGSEIPQISVVWEAARADGYQLRVGNDDPTAITTDNAASYGTPVYTAPANAGNQNMVIGGKYYDVATGLTPATGRYLMLLMTKYTGTLGNYSVWELRAETVPGTVTGAVVDEAGQPVASAYLTDTASGQALATTNASGVYTISGAAGFPYTVDAHKPTTDGTLVYPISAPVSVTPTAEGATGDTLTLPNTVDNQVGTGVTSAAWWAYEPAVEWNDVTSLPLAIDKALNTRWVTKAIPDAKQPWNNISAATPYYYVVDLGEAKTFDQAVIHWELARSGGYSIEVSDNWDSATKDSGTWTTVYRNAVPVGYRSDMTGVGNRWVDAVTFPQTTARFVRIVMFEPGGSWNLGRLSIWELQLAKTKATPLPPLALATKALAVAGGLAVPTDAAEFDSLNAAGGVDIDIADAVALAQQGK